MLHDVLGPPRHIFIVFNSCVRVRSLKKQRLPRSLYPLQNMLQKPRFLTCPPQAVFVHRPTWTCNFLGYIKKPIVFKGFLSFKTYFFENSSSVARNEMSHFFMECAAGPFFLRPFSRGLELCLYENAAQGARQRPILPKINAGPITHSRKKRMR